MTHKLEGKIAAVTGGSNGIGPAAAERFTAAGAHVLPGRQTDTATPFPLTAQPATASSRRGVLQALMAAPAFAAYARGTKGAAAAGAAPAPAADVVAPFNVDIAQDALDDLKRRLANTRWPERETVHDWSQGVPLEKARALIGHWETRYDWRRFERQLSVVPQFKTRIDGLGFHFLHVRSRHADALPIILTHGWPGSFIEFLKVIGP